MAQQAVRADLSGPPGDPGAVHVPEGLGRDWTVLRNCRLRPAERAASPVVMIHPWRGIAVLDVAPSATPDAVGAVRAKLDAARFDGIFAGHLPVVHLRTTPRQAASLPTLLDDAFGALPPLDLPGGDAWAGVAARALLAEHTAPPRRDEVVPEAAGEAARARAPRPRRRRGRLRRALRNAGAVLLCLIALGGVLALALKDLSAIDAAVRSLLPHLAAVAPVPVQPSAGESAAPPGDPLALLVSPSMPDLATASPLAPAVPAAPAPDPVAAKPPMRGEQLAPMPEASPTPLPPAPPAAQRAAAPQQPRRPDAPDVRRPPERAASQPVQQQRQPPREPGSDPPPARGASAAQEVPSQRCGRIASRIGSGAPLGEADMRFFNESCVRW